MERFLASLPPALREEVRAAIEDPISRTRLELFASRYFDEEGRWPDESATAVMVARQFLSSLDDYQSSVYGPSGLASGTVASLAGAALSVSAAKGAVVLSSNVMANYWADVLGYSTGVSPRFIRVLHRAFARAAKGTPWEQLATDLTSAAPPQNNIEMFLNGLAKTLENSMTGILKQTAWRGARSALHHVTERVIGDFSQENAWVENYARNFANSQKVLAERTIKAIVNDALEKGASTNTIAHRIRQSWNLTPQHALAVERYRSGLLEQKRTVSSANRLAQGYSKRLFSSRVRTMSSTEAHTAFNLGREAMWIQAVQRGDMPIDTVKMWVTAKDELVCKVCRPMDGVTAPLGASFEGTTSVIVPTAHPNCRCIVIPVTGQVANFKRFNLVFPASSVSKREVKVKEHTRGDGTRVSEHWRKIKDGVSEGFNAQNALAFLGVGAATAAGAALLRNPNMLREAVRWQQRVTRTPDLPGPGRKLTPEQFGKLFDDFKFGEFSTKTSSTWVLNENFGTVAAQGTVRYGDEVAGTWMRSYSPGKKSIHHDIFEIDDRFQGMGFGSAWNKHMFSEYKKLKVEKVELLANMEVGGYAWAKQGFRPKDKRETAYILENSTWKDSLDTSAWTQADQALFTDVLRDNWNDLRRLRDARGLRDHNARATTVAEAQEAIANRFTWDQLMSMSPEAQKSLLLGSSWSGELNLATRIFKRLIRVKEYERKDGTKVSEHFRHVKGLKGRDSDIMGLKTGGYDFPTSWLTQYARGSGIRIGQNSRIRGLANSIIENGFTKPITVWVYEDGPFIRDGMHRLEAAHLIGLERVPVSVKHVAGERPKRDWRGRLAERRLRSELPERRDTPFKNVKQEEHFVRWFNNRMSSRGERAVGVDAPPSRKPRVTFTKSESPVRWEEVDKHLGPGRHPGTGTEQDVHASGTGSSSGGGVRDRVFNDTWDSADAAAGGVMMAMAISASIATRNPMLVNMAGRGFRGMKAWPQARPGSFVDFTTALQANRNYQQRARGWGAMDELGASLRSSGYNFANTRPDHSGRVRHILRTAGSRSAMFRDTDRNLVARVSSHYHGSTATNPTIHGIQFAAQRVLGIQNATTAHFAQATAASKANAARAFGGRGYDAYVQAQYAATQRHLRQQGIREVNVMRGMKMSRADAEAMGLRVVTRPPRPGQSVWQEVTWDSQPLNSVTTSPVIANRYATGITGRAGADEVSVVMRRVASADEVFANYKTGLGMRRWQEWIMTGGRQEWQAVAVDPKLISANTEVARRSAITPGARRQWTMEDIWNS
jgi:hypothetical protein